MLSQQTEDAKRPRKTTTKPNDNNKIKIYENFIVSCAYIFTLFSFCRQVIGWCVQKKKRKRASIYLKDNRFECLYVCLCVKRKVAFFNTRERHKLCLRKCPSDLLLAKEKYKKKRCFLFFSDFLSIVLELPSPVWSAASALFPSPFVSRGFSSSFLL